MAKKIRRKQGFSMRAGLPKKSECQFCGADGECVDVMFANGLRGVFCTAECVWKLLRKQRPKEQKVEAAP